MARGNRPVTPSGDNDASHRQRDTIEALLHTGALTLVLLLTALLITGLAILVTGERNWLFPMALAALLMAVLVPVALLPLQLRHRRLLRQHRSLQCMARHDHLTGVFNRGYLMQMCERELALGQRHHYPVSLVLLSFHNAQDLVDQLGRGAADEALQVMAREVGGLIRESDLLGRFEATQFLLVLPHTRYQDACRVADGLCRHLAQQSVSRHGQSVALCVRAGTASSDQNERPLQDLLNQADYALYTAGARQA